MAGDGPYTPPELGRALREVPGLLFEEVKREFDAYFLDFAGQMNSVARANLNTRSGALANSFQRFTVGNTPGAWRAGVFSDSPYAAKQENPSETRPTTRRYLAVPLDAAMTGAGVTRGDAPTWGFERTFVAESRSGKVFVFLKTGQKRPRGWKKGDDDPSIVPLFRLMKSVRPASRSLGFFRAFDEDGPERSRRLKIAATRALERAGSKGA